MIVTTNIRLPEEQLKALKMRAVELSTSVSALLRQAVQQLLGASPVSLSKVSTTTSRKKDPFFHAIGLGSGGPADDSTHHDVYLYRRK